MHMLNVMNAVHAPDVKSITACGLRIVLRDKCKYGRQAIPENELPDDLEFRMRAAEICLAKMKEQSHRIGQKYNAVRSGFLKGRAILHPRKCRSTLDLIRKKGIISFKGNCYVAL